MIKSNYLLQIIFELQSFTNFSFNNEKISYYILHKISYTILKNFKLKKKIIPIKTTILIKLAYKGGRSWTVILVRTLMDGHLSKDAHGWSF